MNRPADAREEQVEYQKEGVMFWRGSGGDSPCPTQRWLLAAVLARRHHELLDAPIEQLRHPDFVLGRAGDGVCPSEFSELLPGLPVNAQNFSVQRQLVETPRLEVDRKQHRIRSR